MEITDQKAHKVWSNLVISFSPCMYYVTPNVKFVQIIWSNRFHNYNGVSSSIVDSLSIFSSVFKDLSWQSHSNTHDGVLLFNLIYMRFIVLPLLLVDATLWVSPLSASSKSFIVPHLKPPFPLIAIATSFYR